MTAVKPNIARILWIVSNAPLLPAETERRAAEPSRRAILTTEEILCSVPAIELALESGKISTSLIQRRLSLGYGRAAKLIDEMEKRGIVSAPEGQKPRTVLITKQQYMEMVLNRKEDLE